MVSVTPSGDQPTFASCPNPIPHEVTLNPPTQQPLIATEIGAKSSVGNETCPPGRGGHVHEEIQCQAQVHSPSDYQDMLAVVVAAWTGCGLGLDSKAFDGSDTSRFKSSFPLATVPTLAFMASSMLSMACLEILSENS